MMTFLNERISKDRCVVVMWGNDAKGYSRFFNDEKFRKIEGVHPSPLSANRGFFGSKPFSKVNIYLKHMNVEEIDWSL